MSRQVTVRVGDKEKTYTVKPLKAKYVRDLLLEGKDRKPAEEVFLTLKYAEIPESESDEMDYPDCQRLCQSIFAETFGVEVEQKNSPQSGSGTQETAQNTAKPAK